MPNFTIADVRVFLVAGEGEGGDYFQQRRGHWLIDTLIANPMSGYEKYKASRQSWGDRGCSARSWSRSRPAAGRRASPPASAARRRPG